MISKDDIQNVGVFVKPHGIKGEISLLASCEIEDIPGDDPYIICEINGICVPFFIESHRHKSSNVHLFKFAGIDSEAAARKLSGKEAYLPAEGIADILPDAGKWNAFIGYFIIDKEGNNVGTLTAIDSSTINILLSVNNNGEEILIPAVEEWLVKIDRNNKQLTFSLPDGLLNIADLPDPFDEE
ncbi:MAG: ribosome maturation factor RimM [Tannerellaceae bacterium]|jgi:16S rRNA processing protein RimM|nr:ribosome maturation factor RimM [Tannerellaceae bacterium]